ncbi:MAG: DUF4920 domain-containing protein [bacterium]|nr:DUF4920 domain-containing protein [bacterium]
MNPRIPAAMMLLLLLLAGSAVLAGEGETTFGEGVDDGERTPIADIVADPDAWKDKVVRVQGKVTGVCPASGCWMDLEDAGATLRIKVEHGGEIAFPVEAIGKTAVAQGPLEIIELTRERYVAWHRHVAEELGEEFDESSVGDGPYRLVQIAPTGVEVE